MNLHVLSLEQWKVMSANAHALCFTDSQDPESLTCSYVLLVTDVDDTPIAYTTVLEINKSTAYMQHGGGMPHIRGTTSIMIAYQKVLEFLRNKYVRLSTRILNKNIRMLKLAMSQGLLITGMDAFPNEIFLTLTWEAASV